MVLWIYVYAVKLLFRKFIVDCFLGVVCVYIYIDLDY
jgi:hypothetical protein